MNCVNNKKFAACSRQSYCGECQDYIKIRQSNSRLPPPPPKKQQLCRGLDPEKNVAQAANVRKKIPEGEKVPPAPKSLFQWSFPNNQTLFSRAVKYCGCPARVTLNRQQRSPSITLRAEAHSIFLHKSAREGT